MKQSFAFHSKIIIIRTNGIFAPVIPENMPKPLDSQQKKLLELIKSDADIFHSFTLREIGEKIGVGYAQWVLNKLKQLENRGYIRKDENGAYRVLMDPVEGVHFFPFIGFAQCGNFKGATLDEIEAQEKIPFPTKTLPLGSKSDLGKFFFTKAKGNSMEPDVKDGDLLLVKHQKEATEKDKTLLLHNGTPKIKYLKRKDEKYVLFSLNRDIDDFELSERDEIEIVGVVKLIISNA